MTPHKPLTIIAAIAANKVIGQDGKMPWRSKPELKHFSRTTMGQALVMGRKTFESIGHALPGRMTVVVTRQANWRKPGCETRASLQDAIAAAQQRPCQEVFIAGGAQIYLEALPLAEKMIISHMDLEPSGDAFFPDYETNAWQIVKQEKHADQTPGFRIEWLQRIK